jgi:hypothetical protein
VTARRTRPPRRQAPLRREIADSRDGRLIIKAIDVFAKLAREGPTENVFAEDAIGRLERRCRVLRSASSQSFALLSPASTSRLVEFVKTMTSQSGSFSSWMFFGVSSTYTSAPTCDLSVMKQRSQYGIPC